MSEPFLGEVRMFGFNFAPNGWGFCDGSILPIAQHTALFSLLGTNYGGDGKSTFALPDLRGRVPIHTQGIDPIGTTGGAETVSLTGDQLPVHRHAILGGLGKRDASVASGAALVPGDMYGRVSVDFPPTGALAAGAIESVGGGAPHSNMQPYLVVNFCIAFAGIFPSRG